MAGNGPNPIPDLMFNGDDDDKPEPEVVDLVSDESDDETKEDYDKPEQEVVDLVSDESDEDVDKDCQFCEACDAHLKHHALSSNTVVVLEQDDNLDQRAIGMNIEEILRNNPAKNPPKIV